METAYGLNIPRTLEEVCHPQRMALVVYDMQVGIVNQLMGLFQTRQAMAWQRVDRVEDVEPWFPRDSPQVQIVPELKPLPSEAVSDKIAMSAFSGTFLDMALRDLGIVSFTIVGIA